MADADRFDLTCVERGWRSARLDDDTYLFDEHAEYLAKVKPTVLGRLDGEVPAGPLSAVLQGIAQSPGRAEAREARDSGPAADTETIVRLTLLGVRVDVRCRHQKCADDVGSFYSASHAPQRAPSPEVVVWCETQEADRYLFRSRPDDTAGTPLDGVYVQTLRTPRQAWTSTLPPLPALASWPFKDRFVALHAAAIRTANEDCILIAGERGSGKTTAALSLADRLGAEVLCDETAFVHCRTSIIEPFPHAVGVWQSGRKVRVPITDACAHIGTEPALIRRLVFLQRHEGSTATVGQLSRSQTLRALLSHHRDGGASIGDAMQTVMNLAARGVSWKIDYSRTEDLLDAISDIVGSAPQPLQLPDTLPKDHELSMDQRCQGPTSRHSPSATS